MSKYEQIQFNIPSPEDSGKDSGTPGKETSEYSFGNVMDFLDSLGKGEETEESPESPENNSGTSGNFPVNVPEVTYEPASESDWSYDREAAWREAEDNYQMKKMEIEGDLGDDDDDDGEWTYEKEMAWQEAKDEHRYEMMRLKGDFGDLDGDDDWSDDDWNDEEYDADDDDTPEDPEKNSEEPLQCHREWTNDFLKYKILYRDGEERNRVLLEKNREILESKGYIEDNLKKYYIDIKIGKKAKENPGKYEKIYELARYFLDKKILEAKYGNRENIIGLVLYILEKTDYSIYMIEKMKEIFENE